jgi:hypothetical protein
MLENVLFAGANDWLQLLEFPGKAIEWTKANETILSSALERYKKRGVREVVLGPGGLYIDKIFLRLRP